MVLACTTTTYMLLYPVLDQGGIHWGHTIAAAI